MVLSHHHKVHMHWVTDFFTSWCPSHQNSMIGLMEQSWVITDQMATSVSHEHGMAQGAWHGPILSHRLGYALRSQCIISLWFIVITFLLAPSCCDSVLEAGSFIKPGKIRIIRRESQDCNHTWQKGEAKSFRGGLGHATLEKFYSWTQLNHCSAKKQEVAASAYMHGYRPGIDLLTNCCYILLNLPNQFLLSCPVSSLCPFLLSPLWSPPKCHQIPQYKMHRRHLHPIYSHYLAGYLLVVHYVWQKDWSRVTSSLNIQLWEQFPHFINVT